MLKETVCGQSWRPVKGSKVQRYENHRRVLVWQKFR